MAGIMSQKWRHGLNLIGNGSNRMEGALRLSHHSLLCLIIVSSGLSHPAVYNVCLADGCIETEGHKQYCQTVLS